MSRIGVDLMKTKQEYEKALKEINDAFYGANFLNNQTRRFDNNLNLLRELVNEHFKKNVETNFEHYKDGIIELCVDDLAISKGKVVKCCAIPCSECDFEDKNGHCIGEIMKWLKQPYINPVYKLTKFEIDLLQSCSQGYSQKYQFKNINSLTEMRKNGYFKGVNRDAMIEEIIAKSEVVG